MREFSRKGTEIRCEKIDRNVNENGSRWERERKWNCYVGMGVNGNQSSVPADCGLPAQTSVSHMKHESIQHALRVVPSVAPRWVDLRTGLDVLGIVVRCSSACTSEASSCRWGTSRQTATRRRWDRCTVLQSSSRTDDNRIAVCINQACNSTI